jgi:hypothetical protein
VYVLRDCDSSGLGVLDTLSFATDGAIGVANFAPDGHGILFVESKTSDNFKLRFLSTVYPGSTILGEWTSTNLWMTAGDISPVLGAYPVDPTGCFTIIDTDLAPGPGTRLVLLPN